MSRTTAPTALPLHDLPPYQPRSLSPAPASHDPRSPSRSQNSKPASSASYPYLCQSVEETANQLKTSLSHGLTQTEAATRLNANGLNELPREEPEPLWLRFVKQFKETLILLLLGSAAVSLVMGEFEDAVSIAAAVTIVVTVGFVQEYRSEKSVEALSQLVPHFANVTRDDPAASSQRERSKGTENGSLAPTPVSKRAALSLQHSSIGTYSTVPAAQLVTGDLVVFNTGDRVPADLRITAAVDLSIDESNLTGENEPVSKCADTLQRHEPMMHRPSSPWVSPATGTVGADIRLNDQKNIAFMGTLVRSGYGKGIVVATGSQTEFGAISASLQEIESPRTPLQLSMDRLGKELSYMSFGVIAFIMILGLWRGWEFLEMFQIGVSLAVAAIPEGLPIIVTVTLALGVLRMSRRHAIVRRLPSVETLGSVNVVCTDKTGTLTTNHMTVTKTWHFGDTDPVDISKQDGVAELDQATRSILRIGNIVNNGRLMDAEVQSTTSASSAAVLSSTLGDDNSLAKSRWIGQPTDVALLDLIDSFSESDVRARLGERRNETPFSSERKWMGVVIRGSSESQSSSDVAYIKGALEKVISRCDSYLTAEGREIVLDDARRQEAILSAEKMAQEGLRVLGFASGPARDMSRNAAALKTRSGQNTPTTQSSADEETYRGLVFAGLVGMSDPPRKNVDRSIKQLIRGGVRVVMITGDAETTAVAIGKKLGMPINQSAGARAVLRGDELEQLSEDELSDVISTCTVFARTSPEHKLKIVKALQRRGDVVAMTGDGVNDAPALKKADIGISMGKLGTDVAKEAADMILTDDDFSTILGAIEEGKGIFYNIQNFLTFQLSTSAAALSLVLLATFFGLPNPLNAMQILWINILMDGPPAQSLGVEPVDPAVMSRPPRTRNASVLTQALIRRVLQSASVIVLGVLLIYWQEMGADGEVTAHDTTMTFTTFVCFDMFNALSCRSEGKSVLAGEVGLFSNKMFNLAVSGSLIGQLAVIYLPVIQSVFQTEPLSLMDLIRIIAVASCVFWVDEGRKYFKRAKRRGNAYTGYSGAV